MFLKREKPETDGFAIKRISGCEGDILSRNSTFQGIRRNFLQVLTDTLTKTF